MWSGRFSSEIKKPPRPLNNGFLPKGRSIPFTMRRQTAASFWSSSDLATLQFVIQISENGSDR